MLLDPLPYFIGAFHLYLLNVKYSLKYSNPQSTFATNAIHQNQKPLKHQLHSKSDLILASPHTILKTLNIRKIPKQSSSAPTNYLPIQWGLKINLFVLEGSFIMPCSLRGLPGAKGVMHIKMREFLASHPYKVTHLTHWCQDQKWLPKKQKALSPFVSMTRF